MLVMRVLQGFGGAMMTPVGRLILLRSFPRSDLVSAMNWMTIPAMIGPTVGPIVGGFLTTYLSWRAIFYLNLPIGVLGVVLALWLIEDFRAPAPTRFDLRGFFIAGLGLAMLELAIENVGRPMIPGPLGAAFFIAAFATLLLYGWHARRREDPILDLRLLRIRTFRIGTVTGSICRMGLDAAPFLLPLLFQVGFGFSPLQSGLLTFSSSLGAMLVRNVFQRVIALFRFSPVAHRDCLPCRRGDGGLRAVTPGHPGLAYGPLGVAVRMRAQHSVSRPQHDQLCRRARRGIEQEHQRRWCRATTRKGLWNRRRCRATGDNCRPPSAYDRRFPASLLSDRPVAAAIRIWVLAPFAGRWRRGQRARPGAAPLGVDKANANGPPPRPRELTAVFAILILRCFPA
jgi:hypothetical protein